MLSPTDLGKWPDLFELRFFILTLVANKFLPQYRRSGEHWAQSDLGSSQEDRATVIPRVSYQPGADRHGPAAFSDFFQPVVEKSEHKGEREGQLESPVKTQGRSCLS